MPKMIKDKFDECLTYDNLLRAHKESRKGKNYRHSLIRFNLKQEEYIMWIYNNLKNLTYKHGGYRIFYVKEPKLRKIEASTYIDRVVHRWYVNSFLEPYFIPSFINTSYACIKNKGMHLAAREVQRGMLECKNKYNEYYILKMDVEKYFQNIDKEILYTIIKKKIKDKKVLWLTRVILDSKVEKKGIPIRQLYFSNIC